MVSLIRVAVLAVCVLQGCAAVAQDSAQVITLPLSKPGEPVSLEISILSARIEVIGEDRQDAEFSVNANGGGRKIITPSGSQPFPGGGYQFEVHEKNNHLEVETDALRSRVAIVARIPRRADLDLSTVNNGEIIVRDIEGKLQLRNVNGPITATNISGSVIAEAINKDITIDFIKVDNDSVSALNSINGDLKLGITSDIGVELHLDNNRGEIMSDFEVEVQPSKPVVNREEGRGGVTVKVENAIVAKVNGGGPIIKMKTLNGDIQINRNDK